MKTRLMLAVATALCFSASVSFTSFAQENEKPQSEQKRERQKMADTKTLTGCLTKGDADDQYVLTDDSGMKTTVTASADVGLEKHTNHTVKLTGTLADQSMTATKLEHISASCSAAK